MYNRYIPEDVSYTPVEKKTAPQTASKNGPRQSPFRIPDFLSGKEGLSALFGGRGLSGGEGGGLSKLLKTFHLDNLDSGDVLLLLIMLYLLAEGDDLELVIALCLVVIMGLGDGGKEEGSDA